ncbi:MAG: hypothetical protein IT270_14485 [Saprospiraceae bacterium]|nr:hypothetical protein [Saprospiraceae bacterium]
MLRQDLNPSGESFRQPQRNLSDYSDTEAAQLKKAINAINLDSISDPAFSQEFDYLLDKISRAYGYDHDAVRRSLAVKRKGETDYLLIEITTENPRLSQYMADTYVRRFMTYYQNLAVREKKKNVAFYQKLAIEKKNVVDSIRNVYYNYLFQRGLPALGKQSEELVTQITELELQRQEVSAKLQSSQESVRRLDQYMNDRQSLHAVETRDRVAEKINTDALSEKMRQLTAQNLQSGGKDSDIKTELESTRTELDQALRANATQLGKPKTDNARTTKEDLYKQKVSADLDRIAASNSLNYLNRELGNLKGKLSSFVANDEVAKSYESEQERAQEEFAKVNDDLIDAELALENTENPLSVIENAQLPEWPEPNRQIVISAFAGIVAATFCTIALFLLAYFDGSLQSPEIFRHRTGNLPLMGAISTVSTRGIHFQNVFFSNGHQPQFVAFRESLRALRAQLLQTGQHIYLFVSTQAQEGKTFTLQALAHSLAANNKKVLVLDTNFKTPQPVMVSGISANSDMLLKLIKVHQLEKVFELPNNGKGPAPVVDVINNTGLRQSPSEMFEPEHFRAFLSDLRGHYDFIFLEAAALNHYADARELAPFADQVIAVFNADSVLRPIDFTSIEFLQSIEGQFAGSVLTQVDERNMQ